MYLKYIFFGKSESISVVWTTVYLIVMRFNAESIEKN